MRILICARTFKGMGAPVSAASMPIGIQLIGKHFDEPTILRVAHQYEQSTPWHKQKPKLKG